MGSRAVRSVAVVFLALVMAALGIFAFGPAARQAEASDPSGLSEESLRVLKNLSEDTKSADAATRARAQRVLTRSMRSAYLKPVAPTGGGATTGTSITPALMRAGLAGAAAGIWMHNGVTIYNGVQCGQADCPEPLKLDAEFQRSAEAGGNMIGVRRNSSGEITGVYVLTSVGHEYDPSADRLESTFSYEWAGDIFCSNWCMYGRGWGEESGYAGHTGVSLATSDSESWRVKVIPSPQSSSNNRYGATTIEYCMYAGGGPDPCLPRRPYRSSFVWENPVFDVREAQTSPLPPDYAPAPGDYVPSAEQNEELLRGMAKDPEYDPTWAKPWLSEGFRAPSDPREREALWGPVVGTWATPSGGECFEFASGTQLCDSPHGSTFAWVIPDGVAWMQYQDGGKQWMARPGPQPPRAPPSPGDGSGSTTLYRVIDQVELQDVQQLGDYHLSPHGGGKYFAVTEQGARNFANSYFNRDKELTLTSIEVPNWFLAENGYQFDDIGQGGAGPSYHFSNEQLAEMYEVMGPVKIVGRAN